MENMEGGRIQSGAARRGRKTMKTARAVLGAAVILVLLWPQAARGDGKAKTEIDESEIYYGNASSFSAPAMVDLDAVYAQIPEYREILDRNLDENSPRYHYLMRAASDKFVAAVASAAEDGDTTSSVASVRSRSTAARFR